MPCYTLFSEVLLDPSSSDLRDDGYVAEDREPKVRAKRSLQHQ
ncbi:hypothetical protein C5167_016393 [Papaver somniferum]|nr:hypothetical protein C5167_016393 [Papaver somniferum]